MPNNDQSDAGGSQPPWPWLEALQIGTFVFFAGVVLTVPAVVGRLPLSFTAQIVILALTALFALRYGPQIIIELPRRLV